MNVKFFDPGAAYRQIKEEVDAAMQDVLDRGDLILRGDLEEFEKNFAEYVGTKYAVGVANGTDAIYLSLMAHDINEKDVVLCPSYTFRATPDSVLRTGAEVILYDHEERPHFTSQITAWTPAWIAGEVPEWAEEAIAEAKAKGIIVVEDAAQAIGAAPVRGDCATYSFYPAKILGCYGDGGAIATNEETTYELLKRARNHFKGETGPVGLNSRLDNLQAAVLNIKLKYLPAYIKRRKEIAEMYDLHLEGVVELPNKREVYQDYIIAGERMDDLYNHLKWNGVETMRNGYPFAQVLEKGPKTKAYEERSLRLPCNEVVTNEEILFVIQCITDFYAKPL